MSFATKRYRAFISYCQADKGYARRLHKKLEAYRVPKDVKVNLGPVRKIGRLFLDDEEMGAETDLGAALRGAIEDSEGLIVVCSPHAASSKWVNQEIIHFKRIGRADHIFAIIVDGQPNSERVELECFPPALRYVVAPDGSISDKPAEPLALDLRKEAFSRVIARLAAGLLNLPFDDLWKRDRRRAARRRARIAIVAASAIAGALIAGLMFVRSEQLQASRLLAEAANTARKAGDSEALEPDRGASYDRALRLSVLAARGGWLAPPAINAETELIAAARQSYALGELRGHTAALTSAQFSADGKFILTTSTDQSARLWDSETLSEVVVFEGHSDEVLCAAFDNDGRRVATGSADETVRVWSVDTGAKLAQLNTGPINLIGFINSDNNLLFAGESTYRIEGGGVSWGSLESWPYIWNIEKGNIFSKPNFDTLNIKLVVFNDSKDHVFVAGGISSDFTGVYDPISKKTLIKLKRKMYSSDIAFAALSPDGSNILTSEPYQGETHVWNMRSNEAQLLRKSDNNSIRTAAFSNDGRYVVAGTTGSLVPGAKNGTAYVWNTSTGNLIAELKGHFKDIASVAFHPNGRKVATAGEDGTARIWLLRTWKQITGIENYLGQIVADMFAGDISTAPQMSDTTPIGYWDGPMPDEIVLLTPVEIARLEGHQKKINIVTFSPNGDYILTASEDGTARLWSMSISIPEINSDNKSGLMPIVCAICDKRKGKLRGGLRYLTAGDIAAVPSVLSDSDIGRNVCPAKEEGR